MTTNCRLDLPPVPQRIITDRLIIRPTKRSDAPYLQSWWNGPEVNADSGMQYDAADMENWFARYVDGRDCFTHFVIAVRAPHEKPIGEFYIASDDRPGCIGFALAIGDTDEWGKSYGSEALEAYAESLFKSGQCEAMRMDTRIDNIRAIRMAEKVGFQVEHIWANGLFQTMILTHAAFEYRRYKAEVS